ncbi:putative ATP synthase subunit E, mitochondrial [Tricharina praecox]|uniref:putative ATP synthase subunit E, mitochondrial n=1 Tax=Tricharina praecox TaxID=43433 RepID=UPI00221FE226|nr:putative ATP synthase subunit E, mitochondrial [Tricharina praecox]KAI5849032.1 putative ATP synthase subunit E, mitochondrial [Tricharina praecox]
MVLSTQAVNVLRYSALGSGILYGLYHQRQLSSAAIVAADQAEYNHKAALIKQAKAEWARKHPVKAPIDTGDLITDPDDKRFDLEKFLKHVAGEA